MPRQRSARPSLLPCRPLLPRRPAQSPLASGVRLLTHPLDEPCPVLADVSLRSGCPGAYAGWCGEEVVWAARGLPFVATYSEVGGHEGGHGR